jgi:hypothetical protein
MEPHIQLEEELPSRERRRQRWIARWAQTRRRGRFRYVLRNGILFQGIPYATLITLANYFGVFGLERHHKLVPLLFAFSVAAAFFGVIMGFLLWHLSEKIFQTVSETSPRA